MFLDITLNCQPCFTRMCIVLTCGTSLYRVISRSQLKEPSTIFTCNSMHIKYTFIKQFTSKRFLYIYLQNSKFRSTPTSIMTLQIDHISVLCVNIYNNNCPNYTLIFLKTMTQWIQLKKIRLNTGAICVCL